MLNLTTYYLHNDKNLAIEFYNKATKTKKNYDLVALQTDYILKKDDKYYMLII